MSKIGFVNLPDYYPDGTRRSIQDNRIGFIVGEDPVKDLTYTRSYLREPTTDDDKSSAFGDNAVLHLKAEVTRTPIYTAEGRTFLMNADFGGETDDAVWRCKWQVTTGYLYYQCIWFYPGYGDTNMYCSHYALPSRDWTYDWGWPVGYKSDYSWRKDSVEEFLQFWEYSWQCTVSRIDPVWGSPMGSIQFGWTEIDIDSISYTPDPFGVSVEQFIDFFKKEFPKLDNTNAIKTRLLNDCIEKLDVSDNNIANIKDLVSVVNDVRNGSIQNLITDFRGLLSRPSVKKAGKAATKAWLAYRYAYKTTVADAEELIDGAIQDHLRAVTDQTVMHPLRATWSDENAEWHLKCRCHDSNHDPFLAMANEVRRFGLLPDLHTMWDLIPFSFVVDWFVPVDDVFNSLDRHFYAQGYQFDELLYSCKRKKTLMVAGTELNLTWYERYLDWDITPWDYITDSGKAPVTRLFNRTADGLALLVQTVV